MKSKASTKLQNITGDCDSIEANERYDQFNTIMLPVSRTQNKSPASDEGIEPDAENNKKTTVTRCRSLDSSTSSNGDDEGLKANRLIRQSRFKVTRCSSSDSAVISDDDQNKGEFLFIICYFLYFTV